MEEFLKICKDIWAGALPPSEYGGFLAYVVTKNLGKISLTVAFGGAVAILLILGG
jgi:hypothetical protein